MRPPPSTHPAARAISPLALRAERRTHMPDALIRDLVILGRVLVAVVLGGLIGYEREIARRPAGLRTHMLVAAAATLLISLGGVLINTYADRNFVQVDPVRMIEAIIVGISFLGAGTIFRRNHPAGEPVEGLTTAASILFTAVIGVAVALDQYLIALGSTVIILFVNFGLRSLEQRLAPPPG
jgi:putative Mg2+ transporter-C (MgtC) family protein